MDRKPISLMGSTQAALIEMSEGNPGAITVLMELIGRDDPSAFMTILNLDDMNMRGSQIWVGFKDHCGEDIEKFAQCVNDRDPDMVKVVNSECFIPGEDGYGEEAVIAGASFNMDSSRRLI